MKKRAAVPKQPAGKSRSARAKKHDWAQLLQVVSADSLAYATLDFEEHYVHAIQKALEGRDNRPLFELLDARRMLHPALLPALADVIRSQKDAARGTPGRLTHQQDVIIRSFFDKWTDQRNFGGKVKVGEVRQWLARLYKVSTDTIDRSLDRTRSAK